MLLHVNYTTSMFCFIFASQGRLALPTNFFVGYQFVFLLQRGIIDTRIKLYAYSLQSKSVLVIWCCWMNVSMWYLTCCCEMCALNTVYNETTLHCALKQNSCVGPVSILNLLPYPSPLWTCTCVTSLSIQRALKKTSHDQRAMFSLTNNNSNSYCYGWCVKLLSFKWGDHRVPTSTFF